MTRVSFYKLAGDQNLALALTCKLVEKARLSNQQVLCQMPNQDSAESLNDKLWSFSKTSFIPHGLGPQSQPVAISTDATPGEHYQLLINLDASRPSWFSRFERVIEIIHAEPNYQQAKRDSFSFYKDRGYALEFFDLGDKFVNSGI